MIGGAAVAGLVIYEFVWPQVKVALKKAQPDPGKKVTVSTVVKATQDLSPVKTIPRIVESISKSASGDPIGAAKSLGITIGKDGKAHGTGIIGTIGAFGGNAVISLRNAITGPPKKQLVKTPQQTAADLAESKRRQGVWEFNITRARAQQKVHRGPPNATAAWRELEKTIKTLQNNIQREKNLQRLLK